MQRGFITLLVIVLISLLLALLLFFSCIGTAVGRANLAPHSNQAATVQTVTLTSAQTPTTNPPSPSGYLASGSNYVLFIQFINTNGTLSGEWNEADVVANTSTNVLQVNPFHTNFSAFLNGTQFNLDVNGHTYAGSFDGNNVTIEFPQQDGTLAPITLTPSSIDNDNIAITNLQNNVNQENQNTADVQATASTMAATATVTTDRQNRLNYDLANIGGAISSLNTDAHLNSLFGQYQKDLNQEQKDYQTEQNDAQAGCNNGNAAVVASDVGVIQSDDGVFVSDKSVASSDISNVQSFIDAIQQHWKNLSQQSPGVTQNAQAAISSATSQIHGYDATS